MIIKLKAVCVYMVRIRAVTCGTSREEAPTFGDREEMVLSFKCLVLSLVLDCRVGLRPPPKKINVFRIVRVEIATVAYGSFAMTERIENLE